VPDPSDDFGQLYEDVSVAAGRYGSAQEHLTPVTAKDGHGAVSVTLDPQGRISGIAVGPAWRDHYSADSFGAAVAEAMMVAATTRAQQWGALVVEDQDRPPVRTPLPALHETLAGQLTEATRNQPAERAGGTMSALYDLISEMTAAIDDVSAQVREQMTREYTGSSGSGHVRATLLGNGTLQGLELDRTWAEQAHATNVGRESLQAVQDAYRRLGDDDTAAIIERSSIGRLRRLTEDPVALAREVGLRD